MKRSLGYLIIVTQFCCITSAVEGNLYSGCESQTRPSTKEESNIEFIKEQSKEAEETEQSDKQDRSNEHTLEETNENLEIDQDADNIEINISPDADSEESNKEYTIELQDFSKEEDHNSIEKIEIEEKPDQVDNNEYKTDLELEPSLEEEDKRWECNNRTCIDHLYNLEWERFPEGYGTFTQVITYCLQLDLAEHSDWSAPTVSQMRTFIRCSTLIPDGACNVSDSCNLFYGCHSADKCICGDETNHCCQPMALQECIFGSWWTATAIPDYSYNAWYFYNLQNRCHISMDSFNAINNIRCVRNK